MRRREFITLLAGAVASAPSAYAQHPRKVWRLGVLHPGSSPDPLLQVAKDSLRDLGYVEGRDVIFEIRWAEGKRDRLSELAAELVASKVDVIHAFTTPAALAARDATTTIPVIFSAVGDPVGTGLVPSLAHPGGNVTGISLLATELSAKRLEILREIAPDMSPVAMLWNDTNPSMTLRAKEMQDAAVKLDVRVQSVGVHEVIDLDPAFTTISGGGAAALFTMVDPFTLTHRKRIVEFAAQHRLPAIYESREFVVAGGLVSYGPSNTAMQHRLAVYLDKVFKGAKPSELPVEQPTKFELVINVKTAKALGLNVPPSLIARADEVIE